MGFVIKTWFLTTRVNILKGRNEYGRNDGKDERAL
jgi:hypothetical protein